MYSYKKYSLSLISLLLIISCSKKLMTSHKDDNYIPYTEVLNIKQISIKHFGLKSIINDFIDEVKIFEHGVNSYSSYQIDYFVLVESFCRNDSAFIVLKASAGSYLFYQLANVIDERMLEQFRIAQVDKNKVVIAKDIEESLCTDKRENLYKELIKEGKFKLNWYKKSNGERLIDFHPYFFTTYLFDKGVIKRVKLSFPDRIQELK